MKIRPVRAEVFLADWRTDRHDEFNFAILRTRLKKVRWKAHFILSEVTGYYTSSGIRILSGDDIVESGLASRQRKLG